MGIATPSLHSVARSRTNKFSNKKNSLNSMSEAYQQGLFSFSNNGFERSSTQQQQQHVDGQIRRDKLRVEGFEPPLPLVVMQDEEESSSLPGYETAGMLSEMFNFHPGATTATELLERQIQANYRASQHRLTTFGSGGGSSSSDWYGGDRQVTIVAGSSKDHHSNIVDDRDSATAHPISGINGDSAAAMQLFLMNPQPKSPSPSPSHLHPSQNSTFQSFSTTVGTSSPAVRAFPSSSQFTWVPDGSGHEGGLSTVTQLNNPNEIGGIVERQALSLSLSSSLQHLEAAKVEEELRMGEGGMLFFNNQTEGHGNSEAQLYSYKNLLQSGLSQNHQQIHVGYGSSLGTANIFRNSKYAKAAQELLEEFCSVGRGHQFEKKNNKSGKNNNPNSNPSHGGGSTADGGGSSSSSKDLPPLSAADRLEHQRRKVKLLSMLDEVDRRYNHYCDQMQMVMSSFDLLLGMGAAVPYTALAKKAMSRHFRCLKEAIAAQLRQSCEMLGEKDASKSGVTKGETPRLRLMEQRLRQQKAFHQMGMNMMEQEAWRPQRGLPERSVSILRAWLFEHFLNPYPSDADKHLLARQTGLSRGQVSNWFINARVRLWKPMIEEIYEQEIKQGEEDEVAGEEDRETNQNSDSTETGKPYASLAAVISKRESDASKSGAIIINGGKRSSNLAENKVRQMSTTVGGGVMMMMMPPSAAISAAGVDQSSLPAATVVSRHHQRSIHGSHDFGTISRNPEIGSSSGFIHFAGGTITGDVSLTLGLHHAGNLSPADNNSHFSVRDFGSC